MNTPENTTTKIDGRPENPQTEGPAAPAPIAEAAPPSPEETIRELRKQLEQEKDEKLRDLADFKNNLKTTSKRLTQEKEDKIRDANKRLLEDLLPILDNFELGMMEAKRTAEGSAILVGMGMVQKQLENFLTENGVKPIDAMGQKFDPKQHEALGEEPNAEVPEGQVIRVQRKGYMLRESLLRPASVFVSKGQG